MSDNLKQGGSYVINPDNEQVSLVERTLTPEEAAAAEAEKQASTKPKKTQKEGE